MQSIQTEHILNMQENQIIPNTILNINVWKYNKTDNPLALKLF